jgi:hypothetical protein
VLAYDEGYESGDGILASALWRNLFTLSDTMEPDQLNRVVHYIRYQMDYLHKLPLSTANGGEERSLDELIDFQVPRQITLPISNGV